MLRPASCAVLRAALAGVVALLCMLAAPQVASAAYAHCGEATLASIDDAPPMSLTDVPEEARIDDEKAPPISLEAGASAVAPQPIQNPSDAHIVSGKRCQELAGADEISNAPDEAPLRTPSSVMAAALPVVAPLSRVDGLTVLDALPRQNAPAQGIPSDLFRPPRG